MRRSHGRRGWLAIAIGACIVLSFSPAWLDMGRHPASLAYSPSATARSLGPLHTFRPKTTGTPLLTPLNSIRVGSSPLTPVYDPASGSVFVANQYGLYNSSKYNLSVIDTSTNSLNATVPVGANPFTPALAANGEIYVPDYGSSAVTVVNGTTDAVVTNIHVGSNPQPPLYDPLNGLLYVPCWGSQEVSVINTSSNRVVTNVSLGGLRYNPPYTPGFASLALDTANGDIYVPTSNLKTSVAYGNVTVISGSNASIIAHIPVDVSPTAVTYDPADRSLYVVTAGNLTVLNGSTNTVSAAIQLPTSARGPPALDPSNGQLFLPLTGELAQISPSSRALVANISVGSYPFTPLYCNQTGNLYVPVASSVVVISPSNGSLLATYPVGYTPWTPQYDPANEDLYIANYGSANVSVISLAVPPPTYPVTFAETGLPGGTPWSVTLGGQTNSTSSPAPIRFDVPNGTYSYRIVGIGGWHLSGSNGYVGSVTVSGFPETVVGPSPPVAGSPSASAFDTQNGCLYVAEWYTDNVTVIDPAANGSSPLSIPVGANPDAIAFDPQNGYLYVANYNSANVSVIDGATNTTTGASIAVGVWPTSDAFDPVNGNVYVGNQESARGPGDVTVIDATNDTVVGRSIPVGYLPAAIATDPLTGLAYVANLESDNLTVINDSTETVSGSGIGAGGGPDALAFDAMNGLLFVANSLTRNVTAIDPATGRSIGTGIAVGVYPDGIAYDPVNGYLFVANSNYNNTPVGGGNVTVLNGNTSGVAIGDIAAGLGPSSITFDPADGDLYVTNSASNNTTVIDGRGPVATTWSVTTYPVSFLELGLPAGSAWSVILNGTSRLSTTSTIEFRATNGTGIPFQVPPVAGYTATPSSGTLTVSGAGSSRTIVFNSSTPSQVPLWFNESGLPRGTPWSATVDGVTTGSTTNFIRFNETAGFHYYTVGQVTGYGVMPANGIANMNAAPQTIAVTYTRVSTVYALTFTETGLGQGTTWSVTLGAVTQNASVASIEFTEPNGTYDFAISGVGSRVPVPSNGTISISGANVSQRVAFGPPPTTYSVVFTERGLPYGLAWTVALGGAGRSSTTSLVTFAEPNGSYLFTVTPPTGYAATPGTGTVSVAGGNTAQAISFQLSAGGAHGNASTAPPSLLGLPPAESAAVGGGIAAAVIAGIALVLIRGRRRGAAIPPRRVG